MCISPYSILVAGKAFTKNTLSLLVELCVVNDFFKVGSIN